MTPDRWRRVSRLFDAAAAETDPARRAALLDREARAPGGAPDPDLRAEVERLLALDASDGADLPVYDGALAAPPDAGPWRLVERVGEGGMGEVWRAERADGVYRAEAAVKLVRPGLAPDLVARFRAERHVLARLDHPAIARLLDGGTASDGRPYLALGFVRGEPVTDYADRRRLGVDARLALFTEVCEAVAYAHARLVVHRDLKPSNVLVAETAEGPRVKLLDFGIAKLLGDDGGLRTRTGRPVLTPAYAAPEQAAGGAVTTATDVFGLGVVLYELLAGVRPAPGGDATRPSDAVTTAGKTAGRVPPAPPGDAGGAARDGTAPDSGALRSTTAERLRRRLRGDLDRICLKALRADPARRYRGAAELGADVRRHLDGLPVEARPESRAYRAGKFVRRNRALVAAAAVALVAVVGGAGAALWQAAEAGRQRDRAEAEAETAGVTADFLAGLFEGAEPGVALGDSLTANDLLARGVARAETELADAPIVHARVLDAVGEAYRTLGEYGRADTLFGRAVEVLRPLRAEAPAAYAAALSNRGMARSYLGDYDRAAADLARALAAFAALGDSTSPDALAALNQTAANAARRGDYEQAARQLGRVVRIERAVYEATGAPPDGFGIHLDNYGTILMLLDRPAEGEPFVREALAVNRATLGEVHPTTAITTGNLATLLRSMGRFGEAEPLARRALEINAELLGGDHPDLAVNQSNLAIVLTGRGAFAEAEALFRRSLATKLQTYGPDHPSVAVTQIGLGEVLRRTGRAGEAVAVLRRAVATTEGLPPGHRYDQDGRRQLALALAAAGRTAEGEAVLERGIGRIDALDEPDAEARQALRDALRSLDA